MIVVGKIDIDAIFKIIKVIIDFVGSFFSLASSFKYSNALSPVEVDATPKPKKFDNNVMEIYSRAFESKLSSGKMKRKNLDKNRLNFFKQPLSLRMLKMPFQNNIKSANFKKSENASFVLDKIIEPRLLILPVKIEIMIPLNINIIQIQLVIFF